MATSAASIDQLAINTIRTLSMDAVQAANSGHPGTPMALAPVTYSVWKDHLNYDPEHPHWPARDRFVLSCGHASMLLYSILHLAGVRKSDGASDLSITLDNIKNFRQLHCPCAGHPEFGEAAGIETTTGPLGQGVANTVGMAIAAKWFAERYNRDGFDLFGFDVVTLCSDGDLMEGIAAEAASMAGHLKLGNLCWIYDDNNITIEGDTDLAFSENVAERFEGLGWRTVTIEDANDIDAIDQAMKSFKDGDRSKPMLVILKSIIGYGAPNKQNTADAHGAPLGEEEISKAKEFYGWPDEKFLVPDGVREHFDESIGVRGKASYAEWSEGWSSYKSQYPTEAAELEAIWSRQVPDGFAAAVAGFETGGKNAATRAWSGKVLNEVAKHVPWLIGGSADLAGSNKSELECESAGHFSANNYAGRNFHFGIREHAMAAACNGMSLSGIRSYCATFFVFTDYMRPSMRLSGLMNQPVLYILTHDSIGLGEDGPTHQPVEHLAACRAIPNLLVIRPADGNETAYAYQAALSETSRPTALVLTRQGVMDLDQTKYNSANGLLKGGYVVWQPNESCDTILIGTGSELELCLQAAEKLVDAGKNPRVVSMPCWELFDEQSADYRNSVLPAEVTNRVACEAGIKQGWEKYLGADGKFVGMSGFGASAPSEVLYSHFGITVESIVEAAKG